jgi:predicted aldo/keto reductase-like oxidoreductase
MQRALDLGVNLIDTALVYGKSEQLVGRAIKGRRDRVYISTKNPLRDDTAEGWRQRLDQSLANLGVDYIDFYVLVHDVRLDAFNERFKNPGQGLEAAIKARDEGLIHHFTFSSHDTPENIRALIDTGLFEGMIVQYNLLDRRNEEVIAYAHEKGMGVQIMGPVGGGRLGMHSERLKTILPGISSTAEIALRFVMANPHVTTAMSGMSTMQQVEENCRVANEAGPLTPEERQAVLEVLAKNRELARLYCTGCAYCMPCPQGVGIPQCFEAMIHHKVWGLTALARQKYQAIQAGQVKWQEQVVKAADACVQCGECEEKCPQKIPIIEQLKETHEALAAEN